jgi:homoprotocatechuate degradation regulator HpaR
MQQFSRSLPMMLYRTLDAVMPRFRQIFNEFGLTEQQGRVLRVLWERDEVSLGALAKLTLLPTPSLVGIVDRLSSTGLVTRQRSEKDRRVVHIVATDTGYALQDEIMPRIAAAYASLKQAVDADVWRQVLDGLQQISAAADAEKHPG